MSESKQRGDAVAVVGNAYQLFWVGTGPILAIMEQHGIKVGDRLYHGPAAETAPELVEALQVTTRAASDTLFVLREILRNDGGADLRLENLADALDKATDLGWPALVKAGAE
ncbi:hypothetical protein [Burkholderia gladioli]|uniref:hypothetical protein n=1 Tax=Burkholderia gladioli TaxID=28095 RepID=UPI00163F1ADA|nr:hypothetical protein [Burkholderia gladioli]